MIKQSSPDKTIYKTNSPDRRLSVAPMLDWTDRHDRFFLRLISRKTLLYTEMVTAAALIHGDRERLLGHNPQEHPLALQLAGSDPNQLATAVEIARPWNFEEINLNVGCPSDRVSKGRFGACLMAEPDLVADCVKAMQESADGTEITVKHRIGIDDLDTYDHLTGFVSTLRDAGVRSITVHARKAWLSGLSPKENRSVPPLRHEVVHRLKGDFPDMEIVLNGGIQTVTEAKHHISGTAFHGDGRYMPAVDGVMIGRAAYETPYILAEADTLIFADCTRPVPSRHAIVRSLVPYAAALVERGEPLNRLTRHILGLFHGLPGARAWRRHLSSEGVKPGADEKVIEAALSFVPEEDAE